MPVWSSVCSQLRVCASLPFEPGKSLWAAALGSRPRFQPPGRASLARRVPSRCLSCFPKGQLSNRLSVQDPRDKNCRVRSRKRTWKKSLWSDTHEPDGRVNDLLSPLRLFSAVLRVSEVESRAVRAALTHLLSPQMGKDIVWFLKRWAKTYLLVDEKLYDQVRMQKCLGWDSGGRAGRKGGLFLGDFLARVSQSPAPSVRRAPRGWPAAPSPCFE